MDDKYGSLVQFGISQLVTADSEFDNIVKGSHTKFKVSQGFLSDEGKKKALKKDGKAEYKKCISSKTLHNEADILNMIAPPREWIENRKHWRQMVSSVPATRTDVLELKKKMETFLKGGKAHKTGLCITRRHIMSQVFDELIRHVTVNCAERGLLLIHVRDDLRQVMSHYERLYTSAVAYGIRKTLQSLKDQSELMKKIEKEKFEVAEEKKQYEDMLPYYNRFIAQFVKSNEDEDKEYYEELDKLQKKKEVLKVLVEKSVGPRPTKEKTKASEKLNTFQTTNTNVTTMTTTTTNSNATTTNDTKSRKPTNVAVKGSNEEEMDSGEDGTDE